MRQGRQRRAEAGGTPEPQELRGRKDCQLGPRGSRVLGHLDFGLGEHTALWLLAPPPAVLSCSPRKPYVHQLQIPGNSIFCQCEANTAPFHSNWALGMRPSRPSAPTKEGGRQPGAKAAVRGGWGGLPAQTAALPAPCSPVPNMHLSLCITHPVSLEPSLTDSGTGPGSQAPVQKLCLQPLWDKELR